MMAGVLAGSILVLTACASGQPSTGGQSVKLKIATGDAGQGSKLALLTGTLKGSRSGNTACFWVDVPSGKRPIVWPHGWVAETGPLRLLDADDHGVATVGDHISLRGGDVDGSVSPDYCNGLPGSFGTSGLAR
jgi:hypothetical protein